ncbi:MAG TPA: hypothetical protein VHZ95_18760 [Polyangiales bacterium]|jgi:hypothetical protein|nr:hypothetical protein [Polyangiales bacterium]
MSQAKVTTEHRAIQHWVEQRGGFPAHVKRTGSKTNDLGVLRIDFPGYSGKDTLERVDWDKWFDAFDTNELAFLHQDKTTEGEVSRFNKLVSREGDTAERH